MITKHTSFWLTPLYFAEGLPAAVITEVSLLLFAFFGMNNTSAAFWVNLLGLVPLLFVKLVCAPAVDSISTRRNWITVSQILIALFFLVTAFLCKVPTPIPFLLAAFFLAALTSGIHDIAADGFYILALTEHEQAIYSGLRGVFYRVALVVGSGGFVVLAGILSNRMTTESAWLISLATAGIVMILTSVFCMCFLPKPAQDIRKPFDMGTFFRGFAHSFVTFFQKKHIGTALLFLLLYRLGEAQLGAMSKLFLIGKDGLALSTYQYGVLVGTIGVCMMLAGGVFGGFLCAGFGMRKMLLPMVLAINLPDALYLLLASLSNPPLWLTASCMSLEQFGYGLGFAGYTLFMVWYASNSPDDCKTSHFALMTVFMIAGIRLPGLPSGWIADHIAAWIPCGLTRFQLFFIWVLICTLPGYWVTWLIARIVDPQYGLKQKS